MRLNRTELFSNDNLRVAAGNRREQVLNKLNTLNEEAILSNNVDDLCIQFESEYLFDIPKLIEKEISVDYGETEEPLSAYVSFNSERPIEKISTITYNVPFDGEKLLFGCRPSEHKMTFPIASIEGNEIKISYTTKDYNHSQIDAEFKRELALINEYLGWLLKDIQRYNGILKSDIINTIESRKQKILKSREMVTALGYPIKRRTDIPKTYVVPVIRKTVIAATSIQGKLPFTPEPEIDVGVYDEILSIISSMSLVMERSPHVFIRLDEESIRMHFLLFLNGHFQGKATGETFNYEGKTDILIRENDKNVFIAECKFWHGEKVFNETIDQLLGYTSWRDTKTAILIFNKNKDFTSVLKTIDAIAKRHPNFVREIPYSSESGFRYVYHQRDDKDRELILTIQAFNIPDI